MIIPVITPRGSLRCENEVDADRTRLLREPDDRVLDFLRADHSEAGELVDHDEEVRQLGLPRFRSARCLGRLRPGPGSDAQRRSISVTTFSRTAPPFRAETTGVSRCGIRS